MARALLSKNFPLQPARYSGYNHPLRLGSEAQSTLPSKKTSMSKTDHEIDQNTEEITFSDISPALEFMCWVVVLLAPFLRWINGAAVTTDQFYIQVALFSAALTGAIVLRVVHLVRGR